MLKRARIWLGISLVAAVFGFTGILEGTAYLAQDLFYICAVFVLLSLLFSLFEEPEVHKGLLVRLWHFQKHGTGHHRRIWDHRR